MLCIFFEVISRERKFALQSVSDILSRRMDVFHRHAHLSEGGNNSYFNQLQIGKRSLVLSLREDLFFKPMPRGNGLRSDASILRSLSYLIARQKQATQPRLIGSLGHEGCHSP